MTNLQNLTIDEMRSHNGGEIVLTALGAACLVGGFFVAGVAIGVGAAYVAYKLTH